MPEELTIRRYQPADSGRVRELHELVLRDAGGYVEGVPDEDVRDPLGSYVESGGEFLVGERTGTVVAMGGYRPASDWAIEAFEAVAEPAAELKRMRTDPTCQGKGHGTAILGVLETRARRAGFREFLLDTGADFEQPRAFYERRGYVHERTVSESIGDRTLEMALYRKRLDRA